MPYGGITSYSQSPQLDSPLQQQQHTGALIPQHMGSGTTVYTGSESNGSPSAAAAVTSSALQTTSQAATSTLFRIEDKRLTREAMEKYLRNRNDMIIVILHAKVITYTYDFTDSLLPVVLSIKNQKSLPLIIHHYCLMHFFDAPAGVYMVTTALHSIYKKYYLT